MITQFSCGTVKDDIVFNMISYVEIEGPVERREARGVLTGRIHFDACVAFFSCSISVKRGNVDRNYSNATMNNVQALE